MGCAKPDPRLFAVARERLGLRPGEILHVGDSAVDVAGAEAAGFASLLLVRGMAPQDAPPGAHRIRSLRELLGPPGQGIGPSL